MITAIPAQTNNENARLDEKFGRSPFFALYNHSEESIEFIDNPFQNDRGGVGTSIVAHLAEKKVNQIIANEFGPKAQSLLEQLKIQMIVPDDSSATIKELIAKIKD